jgi:transposase InsO family protein
MDHRLQFVAEARRTAEPFTALCARHGIAPKTGYKWLARYEAEGPAGLHERSRRPHTSPTATAPAVADALPELRRRHPTWGGKKLLAVLARRRPHRVLPAPSTVAALLARAGLVTARRRRRALGHPGRPTAAMDGPDAIWPADFEGEFKTRDGVYCYPLTVCDGYSRALLARRALPSTATAGARPVFERVFREHGLPERIRTDNGVPFATIALARLPALSVWWLRLGILPDLTEPSSPQQNGRHERMHRTLKAEATRPAAADARAQQRVFDRFRREYNAELPHEALGQATPASCYAPSPRPYPRRLPAPEYPVHWEVRRVSRNGGVRWGVEWVNVSHVLAALGSLAPRLQRPREAAPLNYGVEGVGKGLVESGFSRTVSRTRVTLGEGRAPAGGPWCGACQAHRRAAPAGQAA